MAPSPRIVAQLTSTNAPETRWRLFLSSKILRAMSVFPDPVGPRRSTGSPEAQTTCSILSIMSLKPRFFVRIPDRRTSAASSPSRRKREAMGS